MDRLVNIGKSVYRSSFVFVNLFLLIRFVLTNDTTEIFLVRSSKFYLHEDVNSYFGYSISSYVGQNKSFCLIGAPRDFTFDENIQKDVNTGGVYRVSIDNDDCSRVPMSNADLINPQNEATGYSKWLGGSISAAVNGLDGAQLGCDPRFLSKTTYGVNKSEQQLLGIGQCSLYTGATLNYITIQACSSVYEGACLSGFSSSVMADDLGTVKVALGLPGSFLTEGNIYLGSFSGKNILDRVLLKTTPSDLRGRGFNLGYSIKLGSLWNRKTSKSPFVNMASNDVVITSSPHWKPNEFRGIVMVLDSKLDLNQILNISDKNGHIGSYFGGSLETGDFNGDGIMDILVGAPFYTDKWTTLKRKVDVGAVYIFYGAVNEKKRYAVEPTEDILIGDNERGRFGMSLATFHDIDGDGKDDFAVGCPGCGEDQTGSVYIYLGSNLKPLQIIRPSNLNQAPTTPICSSMDESKIHRSFQNFGWSLSGYYDLDRNSVPDLLVGDYSSAQVVFLRSRNMFWFEDPQWQLPISDSIEWADATIPPMPCSVEPCRYYISLKATVAGRKIVFSDKLKLQVTIDLDSAVSDEKLKRIQLDPDKTSVIHKELELSFSSFNTSVELFSGMVDPRFLNVLQNNWRPLIINVSLSFRSVFPSKPSSTPTSNWMLHPTKGYRFFISPVKFFKNPECGVDNNCVSDVRVFITDWSPQASNKTNIYYKERIQERMVVIGIGNWGENAFNVRLKITIPSVLEFQGLRGLNCTLSISKDTTDVIALCHFSNPFQNTRNKITKLFLTLNTGSAFRVYQKLRNKTKDAAKLTITVEGFCENTDVDLTNNVASVSYFLGLSGTIKIFPKTIDSVIVDSRNFSTKVNSFQRVYPETLGPPYKAVFTIENLGPSPIESATISFLLPFKTDSGEYILYFLRHINQQDSFGNPTSVSQLPHVYSSKETTNGECRIPMEYVDPLNLNTIARGYGRPQRPKRSYGETQPTPTHQSLTSDYSSSKAALRQSQNLIACNDNRSVLRSIECIRISCTLYNLSISSEIKVTINARLWAETFFQYRISDSVLVTSVLGQIHPTAYGFNVTGDLIIVPVNITHSIIFKGIEDLMINTLPIWPIILGILLGLIVLTFIILMLWKCGFFQRHRQFKAEVTEDSNGFTYSTRCNNSYSPNYL